MLEDTDAQTPSETNFDLEYDYQPLEKGFFQRMEEKVFRFMSGDFLKRKKKEPVKEAVPEKALIPEIVEGPLTVDDEIFEEPAKPVEIAPLVQEEPKKGFADKIREKAHFPAVSKVITNGIALAVFAVGSYLLYSELPMHPELVAGIIMVSVAGNVIIAGR